MLIHSLYETKVKSVADDAAVLAEAKLHTDTGLDALVFSGATGGGLDRAFFLNQITINEDFAIPEGFHAMTAGPVSQMSAIIVPAGSVWTIV